MNKNSVHDLSDDQLLNALKAAAVVEREATVSLIALLAEVDARRLYLGQGFSSLFVYCTQCLHLSEHAAYGGSRLRALHEGSHLSSNYSPTARSR